MDNGNYTTSEKKTMQELLRVHFPGSEIIEKPPGGWDVLELESPKWRGTGEYWAVSKRVVTYDRLKWVLFSFQFYVPRH
jgi:hypothetical protein